MVWAGWQMRLAVLHTAAAQVVGESTFVEERSYVELFEAPRITSTLRNYMKEPGVLLDLSRPAFAMEVISEDSCNVLTETEALRQWLFTQAVGVSTRDGGSAITMVYAGMADGRFVGYYHDEGSSPSRYAFRAVGESPATAHSYGQFANADAVPDSLAARSPTCDRDAGTDGSAVCPIGCDDDGTECTGSASTFSTLSINCPGSSAAEACTPTSSDGAAGCCDKDLRLHFSTTIEARGEPQDLTEWSIYDPRKRSWYIEEEQSDTGEGWSSIYVFSASRELGITRTAKLQRPDGSFHGVLGVDFELNKLSAILTDMLGGRDDSWAYVVEAGTGLLVGTTFFAPLCDAVTFERYAADSFPWNGEPAPTIHESAAALSRAGWRATEEGQILTNTVPGERTYLPKFEATAKEFMFDDLEWLIVVGQNIRCAPNEIFSVGVCEDCPAGQIPMDDRNCLICSEEYPGTVSDEFIDGGIGTKCVCPEGSFSIRDGSVARCEPCSELPANVIGVSQVEPIAWDSADVCPGGVSWQTTICPLNHLWIEIEEPDSSSIDETPTQINLLLCPACVSAPCANFSTLVSNADAEGVSMSRESSNPLDNLSSEEWLAIHPKASCKSHHTGFLCADCEPDYTKVEGDCVLCDKTDWHWIGMEGATAVLIGLYLMSKTWNSICRTDQAEATFHAVDTDGSGFLSGNNVRLLLVRMGNPIAASNNFDQVLADMKAKDIYGGKTCGALRTILPKCCCGIRLDKGWVSRDSVSLHEFRDWCSAHQPRATVGTYVFAIQTFGLVTAKTSSFSVLELFNMDVGAAVKTCRIPNCGLFCGLLGMAVVPVLAGFSMYVGIWYMATRVGTDAISHAREEAQTAIQEGDYDAAEVAVGRLEDTYDVSKEHKKTRGLPLGLHHLQRGFMQLFLFTFAPMTRKCSEMLICRQVINAGAEERRLVSNLQLTCWTGVHLVAASICAVILFIYVVVVPYEFLKHTRRYMKSLEQEKDEQELVRAGDLPCCSICRPSTFLSSDRLDANIRPEILRRMQSVPTLNPTCWDELFKATRPQKYWWFIFILILKMMVNMIFLLGQAFEYNWGMWLQMCLVLAALLSHYQSPYVLKADNRQEQMSFLGLSLVLTITNSGVTYSGGWKWYHVCVVVFVVVLMTVSMCYNQLVAMKERTRREERVARGDDDLTAFTRSVFASVMPSFLLLKDEQRKRIRQLLQVETFEKGEKIYGEGDPAVAFYIVKQGQVAISSTEPGRLERIINAGDAFGAGSLETVPRRRVATAVASTYDVICLRLIRADWLKIYSEVVDETAEEIFRTIDTSGDGIIQKDELHRLLMNRWNPSLESWPFQSQVEEAVQSLMRVFDQDGDEQISLIEFESNFGTIPADDYGPTHALGLVESSPLIRACPFKYFHVNPKTNEREPYSDADNDTIFGAQATGQTSVRLGSSPYEVRFGANAMSSKMLKLAHTGMCQVNLENDNTRIVERLDILDADKLVRVDSSPVASQRATTECVYRWPSAQAVIDSAVPRRRQRVSPMYSHIDPTTNQQVPYSPEDNALIMAAENRGESSVRVADVSNPYTGETARLEVRFGLNAHSEKMRRPSHTGLCQVNLDNQNTRIVVCVDNGVPSSSTTPVGAPRQPGDKSPTATSNDNGMADPPGASSSNGDVMAGTVEEADPPGFAAQTQDDPPADYDDGIAGASSSNGDIMAGTVEEADPPGFAAQTQGSMQTDKAEGQDFSSETHPLCDADDTSNSQTVAATPPQPPQSSHLSSFAPQPAPSFATPATQSLQVMVPPGVYPGQQLMLQGPGGQQFAVVVPFGLFPGQHFVVNVPQ